MLNVVTRWTRVLLIAALPGLLNACVILIARDHEVEPLSIVIPPPDGGWVRGDFNPNPHWVVNFDGISPMHFRVVVTARDDLRERLTGVRFRVSVAAEGFFPASGEAGLDEPTGEFLLWPLAGRPVGDSWLEVRVESVDGRYAFSERVEVNDTRR